MIRCRCESCTGPHQRAYESKYMNSVLRDDSNFWWGFWFGAAVTLCWVSLVILVIRFLF